MPKISKKQLSSMVKKVVRAAFFVHALLSVLPLHPGEDMKGDLTIQPKVEITINNVQNNVTFVGGAAR